MRFSAILNLSSVLVKSYLRATRTRGRVNLTYAQSWILIVIDVAALVVPFAILHLLVLPQFSDNDIVVLNSTTNSIVWQILVGLPIALTSIVILSGILLELGHGSALSSSESVNWLPLTPREYVTASALSMAATYSQFLAVGLGITLPIALKFSLMQVWLLVASLSVLALFLGAFIVEALRAITNRVSSTVYRKSGKFGVFSRLVLVVALLVIIQTAFNSYFLFKALGLIVRGVEIVWFIPMIWPSVAIINLANFQIVSTIIFSLLSLLFTLIIFEISSYLRQKYWSPLPVTITIQSSSGGGYIPQTTRKGSLLSFLSRFGFEPIEIALALKEFRALLRRKELARFVAMPVILIISFFLPTLIASSPFPSQPSSLPAPHPSSSLGHIGVSSRTLFFEAFVPFMVPLMLSTITIGQEGRSIVNLCMLPISAKQLIKGKLLPTWIISFVATIITVIVFEIIVAPAGSSVTLAKTSLSNIFVVIVESFIGLGVGSRYPDFTTGSRSHYVTFDGFLIGFLIGGVAAVAIFIPTLITNNMMVVSEIRENSNQASSSSLLLPSVFNSVVVPIIATIIIGSILSYFSYQYCKKGVGELISNTEKI